MNIELNEDLIRLCNNQSMYNRGDNILKEAQSVYQEFSNVFDNRDYNEQQVSLLGKRKKELKNLIESCYNEYLNIASKYVPINIAGLSKYPVKKQQEINNRMNKKMEDIGSKIEKFFNNTEKMLNNEYTLEEKISKYRNGYDEPISSDDPNAKELLNAKLAFLEERHQKYKEYNKKARKNGEKTLAPYVIANSNQNIKSVKDRLKLLEKMSSLNEVGYYFANGEVKFDKEDNRVKIFFDEKPNDEIREKLKSHAYKWSPTNQCWQRKLTLDAIRTTKGLFADIGSLQITKVYDYSEDKKMNI